MSKIIELSDSEDERPEETLPVKSTEENLKPSSNVRPRHNRRKSTHKQTVRASPDIQFESLPLEMSNQQNFTNNNPKDNLQIINATSLKTTKLLPNILSCRQLTSEEIFNSEFEGFLKEPETVQLVAEIAKERLRINKLLLLNGMPEINFTLFTKSERLEFQLEERFKQREIREQSRKHVL